VLDDYLLREVTTGQHISGTCKMGPVTDPMASVHYQAEAILLETMGTHEEVY
jgi:choline dehydrogenase-like flavoprotein